MSKEEDVKFLKIQTCVLKVYIHCDGCKQKVKKLLQKIDGVYTIAIDADQGKVTISGNVDPASLIKKLAKNGKRAELLFPKPNIINNNNKNQKLQLDNGKGGGKAQKGGGGGGGAHNQKGQPPQQQQLPPQVFQDLAQFKDIKIPPPFMKDPKTVKFNLPVDDDGSDFDDDDDFDDDFDDDDMDDFDDDFDDDFEEDLKPPVKMKPMSGPPVVNEKKGGGVGGGGCGGGGVNGNGKKGSGGGNVPVNNKGIVGGSDGKSCNNGKKGGGGGKNNGGGGQNGKDAGANNQGGKKGGKSDLVGSNPNPALGMGGGFPPHLGGGVRPLQMAQMGANANAVQGLPAGGGPLPGYFPGGGPGMAPPPEMAATATAAANPYQQQQYLAAMMQQQRMMMNGPDRSFQPMAYARPPVPVTYMPPAPEYTHFFSDENTNSCSVM